MDDKFAFELSRARDAWEALIKDDLDALVAQATKNPDEFGRFCDWYVATSEAFGILVAAHNAAGERFNQLLERLGLVPRGPTH